MPGPVNHDADEQDADGELDEAFLVELFDLKDDDLPEVRELTAELERQMAKEFDNLISSDPAGGQ